MSTLFEQNKKVVCSLYRQSLRLSRDWINRRDLWRLKALEIRREFDANKEIAEVGEIKNLISQTQQLLTKYAHPDPIIPPQRPGGTKFERNVEPPQGHTINEHW